MTKAFEAYQESKRQRNHFEEQLKESHRTELAATVLGDDSLTSSEVTQALGHLGVAPVSEHADS